MLLNSFLRGTTGKVIVLMICILCAGCFDLGLNERKILLVQLGEEKIGQHL